MKLLALSVSTLAAGFVFAYLILNGLEFSGTFFFLSMAIYSHLVIELAAKTTLERDHGFMSFILCHLVGEAYLFAMAVSSALSDALYPIYSALYDHGMQVMLTLTVLSLLSASLTIILRNTGRVGGSIGSVIDRLYSAAMSISFHSTRS